MLAAIIGTPSHLLLLCLKENSRLRDTSERDFSVDRLGEHDVLETQLDIRFYTHCFFLVTKSTNNNSIKGQSGLLEINYLSTPCDSSLRAASCTVVSMPSNANLFLDGIMLQVEVSFSQVDIDSIRCIMYTITLQQ